MKWITEILFDSWQFQKACTNLKFANMLLKPSTSGSLTFSMKWSGGFCNRQCKIVAFRNASSLDKETSLVFSWTRAFIFSRKKSTNSDKMKFPSKSFSGRTIIFLLYAYLINTFRLTCVNLPSHLWTIIWNWEQLTNNMAIIREEAWNLNDTF